MPDAPVTFNPFDRTWWSEPYSLYDELISKAPTGSVAGLPIWYFTAFEDCESVLRDGRFGRDERKSGFYATSSPIERRDDLARSFLFLDPPDHTRLRGLVARAFTPRVVDGLAARISATVQRQLAGIAGGEEFDLVSQLAYPVPITVISDLLGIPQDDRDSFHQWSRHLVAGLDPELVVAPEVHAERRRAIGELRSYMLDLIAVQRSRSAPGLVGDLARSSSVDQAVGGDPSHMSGDELVSTLVLLLVAGYETTVNLIANLVLALARRPETWRAVSAERSLVAPAVEETLRFDPPVQLTSRVASSDVSIGGVTVPTGAFAIVLIAAANRDPRHFAHPAAFDPRRENLRHLSFSLGIHHCLGATLARAEAAATLEAMLTSFSSIELAGEPSYRETLVLRGIERLPLVAVRR